MEYPINNFLKQYRQARLGEQLVLGQLVYRYGGWSGEELKRWGISTVLRNLRIDNDIRSRDLIYIKK